MMNDMARTIKRSFVERAVMRRSLIAAMMISILSGCASFGASGPSSKNINKIDQTSYANQQISLVDLNSSAVNRIGLFEQSRSFAALLGDAALKAPVIGIGDTVDISIWEAPPAVLFGTAGDTSGITGGAQSRTILQRTVGTDGTLAVPFVGPITVAGRSSRAVEREIIQKLSGRANDPQVSVRVTNNDASNVTVLGEVTSSRRVPLGPRGERLLDIIANAGGTRQPVGQTTVQLSRGTTTASMALERVIQDPSQNIRMQSNDVVTVLHQPYSFIALGALSQNAEIPFEGKGISLAQALGRTGGLRNDRANIKGVFIFRLESPDALDPIEASKASKTQEGKIPVVYRLNLADAKGFFVAQDFEIRDKDVLYVSTAPGADIQRFLSTVTSLAFSAISIGSVIDGSPN